MKEENANPSISDKRAAAAARFSPQVPPGFTPKARTTTTAAAAAADSSISDRTADAFFATLISGMVPPAGFTPTCTTTTTAAAASTEEPTRHSNRKRSRPKFYEPPAPETGTRRRGRPPKSEESKSRPEKGCTNQIPSTPSSKRKRNDVSLTESHAASDDANEVSRSSDINIDLQHMLKAIYIKHGDITHNCSLESNCMKTNVLLGICKVVQDLQKKQLKDLDNSCLNSYYTVVRDAEYMKVNVHWLRSRLDEIKDALILSEESKGLINERDWRVANIDKKKKEVSLRRDDLERLKYEVQDIEEQLTRDVVMLDGLNTKLGNQMSKISQFQDANLVDGLI